MSPLSGPANASEAASLEPGTRLGGRFVVESHHEDGAFGPIFRSRDQKTGKIVKIKLLTHGTPEVLEQARARVKAAAQRRHRNLAAIYGVGNHEGSCRYVAQEWVQGVPLSEFVANRTANGQAVSLRAAYNLVAHVCKALTAIHPDGHHGALRPELVWITKSGRVKVTESGLSRALIETQSWRHLPESSQAFLAPEILADQPASPATDIYGVGTVLLMLLTGHAPKSDDTPSASASHPEASEAVDALISRCLEADPEARFPSAEALTQAMIPLVLEAPEGDIGLELDVEIDIDIATSLAPPAPAQAPAPSPAPSAPQVPAPPQVPSAPQAPTGTPFAAPPLPFSPAQTLPTPGTPADSATDNLAKTIEELTRNDSAKWMVTKDGMDHGPFTTRRLIKLILEGEILPEHTLFGMRGDDRKELAKYAQFAPFVEQYQLRKSETDQKAALAKSDRRERRSTKLKTVSMAGGLAALLALTGGYLMTRGERTADQGPGDVDLSGAYDNGRVAIEGTAKLRRQRRSKHRKRSGGSANSASQSGSAMIGSYNDAMNQAMEMGDATKEGGERQLSRPEVAGVMNRHLNTLFTCVTKEKRGGGSVGSVQIDMAIRGSGSVMGATVTGGSKAFKTCVVGKVKRIKFPTFPSPRMGARYGFDGRQ